MKTDDSVQNARDIAARIGVAADSTAAVASLPHPHPAPALAARTR